MRFCINGNPIPKKRHRTCMVGRYARTYDPQAKQKNCTRKIINDEMIKKGYETIKEGPIYIKISAHMPIPSSLSAKKKALLQGTPCAKRPDIDNLAKYILDVCNGLIYTDDGQISRLYVDKVYSDTPAMILEVHRYDPQASYAASISTTPSCEHIRDLIHRAYEYGMAQRTMSDLMVTRDNNEIKIKYNLN